MTMFCVSTLNNKGRWTIVCRFSNKLLARQAYDRIFIEAPIKAKALTSNDGITAKILVAAGVFSILDI